MTKKLGFLSSVSVFIFAVGFPAIALAQGKTSESDFSGGSTIHNIGEYTKYFFAWAIPITGSLAVLMAIYAGYLYMTSQGNQENITSAKDIIMGVVLGLLLLFTAELILRNVIGTVR